MVGAKRPHFFDDQGGSITVTVAAVLAVILLAVGISVDFGRVSMATVRAQNALDAAVLALAKSDGTMDPVRATAMVKATAGTADGVRYTVSFSLAADGTVTGTVQGSVPTTFTGLFGYEDMDFVTRSKATPPKQAHYATVTMKIDSAQGAFDKEIYAVTYDKNGKVITRQLMLTYDYTLSKGKGTKSYNPPVGGTYTASVGNYAEFVVEMVVYEDLTYTGKRVNPKSYFSNQPDAAQFIKTSGACDTGGAKLDWEDGGDSNFADFKTTMTCTLDSNTVDDLRLIW